MSELRRCSYCGTERPIEEMKQGKTTFRSRDDRGRACIAEAYGWYCKDKWCHGYAQMACEG